MTTWFTGGSKKTATSSPPQAATSLRVQSSVAGKPKAIGWGRTRLSGNLIWYGDFRAIAVQNTGAQGGGGKGGGSGGGGGKGQQQGNVSYTYRTSFAIAIGESEVIGIASVWSNKSVVSFGSLGFTMFGGSYAQTAWPYLVSAHPDQALNYRGLSYVAAAGFDLGAVTELPNFSFEVQFSIYGGIPGSPDAAPSAVVLDYLTNEHYGVGWPDDRVDQSMTQFWNYTTAAGLYVSPALTDQREASTFLTELLRAVNCSPRWSGGKLTVVPLGEQTIFGNGASYVPPSSPLYDLTNDDFTSTDPVIGVRRKPRDSIINSISLEFANRADNYDPDVRQAKDEAAIFEYGLRPETRDAKFFAMESAALLSAHLQLGREQLATEYTFSLPAKFILPDVEDILTLTRPEMAMDRLAVRIKSIEENDDGSLSFTCEDFFGTVGAPVYGAQATSGYVPNYNADPGPVNEPLIFEPTDLLGSTVNANGGGLQVWAAVSGVDKGNWGGCNVYGSYDGITYQLLTTIQGPARMGVTADPLPSFPVNPTGPNIDEGNFVEADLTMSGGALASGTQDDMLGLTTACYVGGEIIAYREATLNAPNTYLLTGLNRGAYGTEASMLVAKPAGVPFARLDQGIARVPFDQNRIGQTIYLKFQSFNVWNGGLQNLADVPAYSYTLTGSALASPLPTVENVRVVYEDGFTKIWWDPVTDFRNGIRYKIFRGPSFEGSEQVFDNAHAPFIAFGSGTYWIIAYAQPVPDLIVTSENAVSIVISGNMLIKNLVYQSNQQTAGWPGTMSNGVAKDGVDPNAFLRLGGSGNILTDPDILANPDVLNYGGVISEGTYTISAADVIDVGYIADCSVNVTWLGTGAPVGQNILEVEDILAVPDILGSASTQYVTVKVQIRTANETEGDLYESDDLYGEADLYRGGVEWSEWQDYTPGVYRARLIDLRMILQTSDPQTIAYALSFSYEVSVPARIDHYPNVVVPSSGVQIVFEPDDSSIPAPFNGGPPVGGISAQPLPFVTHSAINAAGYTVVVDSFDLSQITYHYVDGTGTPVDVASDSVVVTGY